MLKMKKIKALYHFESFMTKLLAGIVFRIVKQLHLVMSNHMEERK